MLSVLISTHNRRALALRTLQALASQNDVGGGFEVVVVVDGSHDGTAEAIRAETWPFPLRIVEQPQMGLNAARNRGAAEASGEALVFFDDDIAPQPNFLCEIARSVAEGADIVVPFVRVADWMPDVLLAREMREWDSEVRRAMEADLPDMHHVHFCATCVRRTCYDAVGGFDPEFTEGGALGKDETEFVYRVATRGYQIVCRPDIIVDADCVTDPAVMLRRGRQYGRNDVLFSRKHPELAASLFGNRVQSSRIERLIAPMVMADPRSAWMLAPLQWATCDAINRGWVGGMIYRFWLAAWVTEYWRGVVEAGGTSIARAGIRTAQST